MAKAAERVLEAKVSGAMVKRGWQPITDPLATYADLVGEVWAWKELCREQLASLHQWWTTSSVTKADDVRAIIVVYERALDRAQKTLSDMLKIGLDAAALQQAKERPTREQAETFSRVLDRVLAGLDLTDEQRRIAPNALASALRQEGLV